jgi:hypothetical protein
MRRAAWLLSQGQAAEAAALMRAAEALDRKWEEMGAAADMAIRERRRRA